MEPVGKSQRTSRYMETIIQPLLSLVKLYNRVLPNSMWKEVTCDHFNPSP